MPAFSIVATANDSENPKAVQDSRSLRIVQHTDPR